MKNWKKRTSFIMAGLCLASFLSACSGEAAVSQAEGSAPAASTAEESGAAESAAGEPAAEEATITFAYWDEGQQEIMDALVAEFEAQNSNINVETTIIPPDQYWTVMQAGLPAGSAPDVFWLACDRAPTLISADVILNLQEYIERDGVDMEQFPETLRSFFLSEGDMYAIPKDYDTINIFYNKELFDQAGVEYPENGWTWDDLLEKAQQLTIPAEDGGQTQYGFVAARNVQSSVFNFMYSNNGAFCSEDGTEILINSPENLEALTFLSDLMFTYKVSPNGSEQQEIGASTMFDSGMAAMIPDGSWMAAHYYEVLGDKVDVVQMPVKERSACVMAGTGFAAAAKTQHPEAAWQFLKFLASEEAQKMQATNVIPALEGAAEDYVAQLPTMNAQTMVDAAQTAVRYPFTDKNAAEVEAAFDEQLQYIWLTNKDVATALADAQASMEEAYNK